MAQSNHEDATKLDEQAVVASIEAQLIEAFRGLKEQLDDREKLRKDETAHRETIHGLNEKLEACNIRVTNAEKQCSEVKEQEEELKGQNATLQAKITALQSQFSPAENAQIQLNEAKDELDMKVKALDSAKADLASKAEELRSLNAANTSLREQLQTLQNRVDELQNKAVDAGAQQGELERSMSAAEERIRQELARHVAEFEAQVKMDAGNEIKRLTSDRSRLEKQMKPLQEELAACKTQNYQLQKEKSAAAAHREQEMQRAKKLSESQKQEIETLQSSLNELHSAAEGDNALQEKYSILVAQLGVEKEKMKGLADEKSKLLQQIEDLRAATEEAELAGEHTKAELEKCRAEMDNAVKALEKELAEANEATERSAAGLEHLKASCKKAIDDVNSKNDRQTKALQERLAESQAEVQQNKAEAEKFRAEIEQTWQQEQESFEERSAALRRQLAESEAQRDEALANSEQLRRELQANIDEQRKALLEREEAERRRALADQEKRAFHHPPPSEASSLSSRLRVPNVKDGITPTANLGAIEPPKPRKKVDRSQNATVEVGPIPAPEELRPDSRRTDSRRTDSAKGKEPAKGPVVEESQLVSDPFGTNSIAFSRLHRDPSSLLMFSDNEDMLTVRNGDSRQLPQTVEEIQIQDSLPSFAALNSSTASAQAAKSSHASPMLSLHPVSVAQSYTKRAPGTLQGTRTQDLPANFAIYEDSQEQGGSSQHEYLEERRHLQDSLSWSQAEKEKYTFQQPVPHPNSASKMIHRNGQEQNSLRRQGSESQHGAGSRGGRAYTPNVRGESNNDLSREANISKMQSSSPDFVHDRKASGRKMSTYHTPGGSAGQRRLSRTNSGPTADPRLAGRTQPTGSKRKAEGYIVEGYEHERKKRLSANSIAAEASNRNLRSKAQPSIQDLPSFPTMHAGPRSSQYTSSLSGSQSRMRTLAGGSSRATRGGKKMSKSKFIVLLVRYVVLIAYRRRIQRPFLARA